MILKDPWILLILPMIFGLVYILRSQQKPTSFQFSSVAVMKTLPSSWKMRLRPLLSVLRMMILVLFTLSLAGPRSVSEETVTKTEGVDIVLAIDVSQSMAAEDFHIKGKRRNRLHVVREVVKEFIEEREHDRIGLVVFGGLAYTICPLTSDYSWLNENLERVQLGLVADASTAVGSAIASSVARLKNSEAKSKVIILLTDGVSNSGRIDPISAAKAAEAFGIKIYAIGVGTKGPVPFPAKDFFGRKVYQNVIIDIDEEQLREVAQITDGAYYRATDTNSLRGVYKKIDTLEKTEMEEIGFLQFEELFDKVLLLALGILLLEVILSQTLLLTVP